MNQRPIESFLVQSIKSDELPKEILGFQPGRDYVDRLLENCPFAFTIPSAPDSLPFNDENPYALQAASWTLTQLSPNHARSLEVVDTILPESWVDEYGHRYSGFNLKGNVQHRAEIIHTATATDRYIAFGLQESAVIQRVLRASGMLRKGGVSTEYILGISEPKEFAIPKVDGLTDSHEFVPLDVYKDAIVHRYWRDLPDSERTAEILVDLERAMGRMTFYVSARAMDTSLRLAEIEHNVDGRNQLFEYTNKHLLGPMDKPYDANAISDIDRFLAEVSAPRLGRNIARLHRMGLAHRYPNGMNVTALGSIVDLDSVHGASLGFDDIEITATDMYNDLFQAIRGIGRSESVSKQVMRMLGTKTTDDHPDPVHAFLEHYKQEFVEVEEVMTLRDIVNAGISTLREVSDDNDDRLTDKSAFEISQLVSSVFVGDSDEVISEIESYEHDISEWHMQHDKEVSEEIRTTMENVLGDFRDLLIDEAINAIRDGDIDLPLQFIVKGEGFDWRMSAMQFMVDNVLQILCDNYTRDRYKDADELSKFRVRHLIMSESQSLLTITGNVLNELLPSILKDSEEMFVLTPHESLIPGSESTMIVRSEGATMLYETDQVEARQFFDRIASLSDEGKLHSLTVGTLSTPQQRIFDQDGDELPSHEVDPEIGILTEVITDGYVDGCDYDHNIDNLISVDLLSIPDASYAAFVEKTREGTFKITIKFVRSGNNTVAASTVNDPKSAVNLLRSLPTAVNKQLELELV